MAKKIIAIDIDDVLAAENEGMRLFINEKFGQKHTPEDYQREGEFWSYWEGVWQVGKEKGKEWNEAYHNSGAKLTLQVLDGAIPAVTKLSKEYKLIIVTSRDDRSIEITHQWLDRHFPGVFDGVEFVHVWSGNHKATKAIVCKAIRASYLIDDNLEHCTLSAEAGLKSLLFGNYGWNQAVVLPEGVTRVADWKAVLEYFHAE